VSEFGEIGDDLARIAKALERSKTQFQIEGTNAVIADISERIHQRGLNSNGRKIGTYDPNYAKKRRDGITYGDGTTYKGLRTDRVDLQVSGDLEASLIAGRSGRNVVGGIAGEQQVKKAQGQEERYGEIWKPSKTEVKAGEKAFLRTIDAVIIDALG